MTKREEFNSALKEALKARDEVATGTIRLITAALKDKDIAARGQGKADGIGEPEILSLLQGMIKQREESKKIYTDAARPELAAREEAEIGIIRRFLPAQLDDAAVDKIVADLVASTGAAGVKDMGKVMGVLKAQYAGQIDMAKAGAVVKAQLGG